jgi:hypothetical protein
MSNGGETGAVSKGWDDSPVVIVERLQLRKVAVERRNRLGPYAPECPNFEYLSCYI